MHSCRLQHIEKLWALCLDSFCWSRDKTFYRLWVFLFHIKSSEENFSKRGLESVLFFCFCHALVISFFFSCCIFCIYSLSFSIVVKTKDGRRWIAKTNESEGRGGVNDRVNVFILLLIVSLWKSDRWNRVLFITLWIALLLANLKHTQIPSVWI